MYNEVSKKATMKYLKTQKQIRFWVKPALYDQIQQAATAGGFASLRQFYIHAIEDLIFRIQNGYRVNEEKNSVPDVDMSIFKDSDGE